MQAQDSFPHSFRVIDDVYYVGSRSVGSHMITSEKGHVLIDTCNPGDGPSIMKSIRDLGFDPKDIKYILTTHAHHDHVGGTKMISEETGAKICVGEADVEAAEKGSTTRAGLTGFATFKVGQTLREGDVVALGYKEIRVYHTPGHTPGCCSFGFRVDHESKVYDVFLFGGAGFNVFQEENLRRGIYGGTVQDYGRTLDRLDTLKVDVWLGAHPHRNNTFQKLELLQKGVTPNPFIDPVGWKAFLKGLRTGLEKYR